jgi:hypothetical protein
MESTLPTRKHSGLSLRTIAGVFKLRIGVVITFTALAGLAVSGGPALSLAQTVILTLAVLIPRPARAPSTSITSTTPIR